MIYSKISSSFGRFPGLDERHLLAVLFKAGLTNFPSCKTFTASTPKAPCVPEKFIGYFASQIRYNVHSMRQLPHMKPPLYSTSTRRISYRVFSLAPFADALHEQNVIELKESALFSGQNEVVGREFNNPMNELQTAKNRTYWSNSNKSQPDKRASYKASLKVSEGEGRKTREIELIW